MKFYTVNDDYIAFLKAVDKNVPDNYKEKRPYVGVVFEVSGVMYLAPLTSYKQKQDSIKSSLPTVLKIHERTDSTNKLGMVQINNMIPVLDRVINLLDIEAQRNAYKDLLYKQYEFLKQHKAELEGKAGKLYELVVNKNHAFYSRISCNFKALEAAAKEYK